MEPFSEQKLEKRLQNLKDTQESIQSLSGWCLQYKTHAPSIVKQWLKAIRKAKVPQRLALLYLANDVLQHSRRKQLTGFLTSWYHALNEVLPVVRDEKIEKPMSRMLSIWEERQVYQPDEIKDLKNLLVETEKNEAPIDYEPSVLFKRLPEFQEIEQETDRLQKNLNEAPINISLDVDNLRSVIKEKGQSHKVLDDLNSSIKCMESVVKALDIEMGKRVMIISLLKKANSFYNHQKSEAKVVCTAYKSFAHRVKLVKLEVEKKLESVKVTSELPAIPPEPVKESLESRLLAMNDIMETKATSAKEMEEVIPPTFETTPPEPSEPFPFFPSLLSNLDPNIFNILSTAASGAPPPPPVSVADASTLDNSVDFYATNYFQPNYEEKTEEIYDPTDATYDFSEEMQELDFLDGDTDMRQRSGSRKDNINTSNLIALTSRGDDSPERLLNTLDIPALTNLKQKLRNALKQEAGDTDFGELDMDLSDDENGGKLYTPPLPPLPPHNITDSVKDVDFRTQASDIDVDDRVKDCDFRDTVNVTFTAPSYDNKFPGLDLDFMPTESLGDVDFRFSNLQSQQDYPQPQDVQQTVKFDFQSILNQPPPVSKWQESSETRFEGESYFPGFQKNTERENQLNSFIKASEIRSTQNSDQNVEPNVENIAVQAGFRCEWQEKSGQGEEPIGLFPNSSQGERPNTPSTPKFAVIGTEQPSEYNFLITPDQSAVENTWQEKPNHNLEIENIPDSHDIMTCENYPHTSSCISSVQIQPQGPFEPRIYATELKPRFPPSGLDQRWRANAEIRSSVNFQPRPGFRYTPPRVRHDFNSPYFRGNFPRPRRYPRGMRNPYP
ncbi:uncharacterized protein LOC136026018 [Artemia franciscana]|uniref:CID domain-containing protein n=1 Tax=Artemia franciscana TaxID=6661 RepID=A0AA88KZC8_ARTSF|nr:hypothetical protein QYM36_011860 [Artemia franciscana]